MPDLDFAQPRPLQADDAVDGFDCGVEELNRYLQRFAWMNQRARAARTYVAITGGQVAGYYTLAFSSVEFDEAPERLRKGLARHPIPMLLVARLAVDKRFQGRRLGSHLLRDAFAKALAAEQIAGMRGVVVDAKDEAAYAFYERFGFRAFPGNPFRLAILTKDIRSPAS